MRTGIPMSEWEAAGERAIVTALDILQDQYYSQLEAKWDADRERENQLGG